MNVVKEGSTVSVHYRGTLKDGEQFDSSYDRGTPIEFTVGSGNMISGFDTGVIGMTKGDKKTLVLSPEEAYGNPNPALVKKFSKTNFPEGYEFNVGDFVQAHGEDGQMAYAKIIGHDDSDAEVDFNHPLAGEVLTFEIELVETKENNS